MKKGDEGKANTVLERGEPHCGLPLGLCLQAMASAAVGTACVTPTGPATTATVPHIQDTCMSSSGLLWRAGQVSVAAVSASPGSYGDTCRSVPPALMPAPLKK